MEITGKVIQVLPPASFVSQKNGNTYVTNVFILETGGKYPKRIAFKVMGAERFAQLGIVVGGTYSVSFDVESREWNGKWFTECSAWRALRTDGEASSAPVASGGDSNVNISEQPVPEVQDSNDSLPF